MPTKLRIAAQTLLSYTTEQLWETLYGEFTLVFPDGEIETNHKETLYSSYAWDFHRLWNKTPISVKHHIRTVLGNRTLGMSAHIDLLNTVKWATYDAYPNKDTDPRDWIDQIDKMVYVTTNNMYNDLSENTEEYMVSLDAMDFLTSLDDEQVRVATEDPPPTKAGIDTAYEAISAYLGSTIRCGRNALGHAFRAGLANKNQVHQCLGPRGSITDIDSTIFRNPVMTSYARGMRSLHDSMIESRSCAKSLFLNKDMVRETEYFSRKLQLLCMSVKNIHPGDCGSQQYITWNVRDERYEGEHLIHRGDLDLIQGKYYLDEQTKSLKIIQKTDTHLIGKNIRMRSAVAGCNHKDPYGVCSVCYGALSEMIQPDTNLGHLNAASLGADTTQNVLSTKHLDGTASLEPIILNPDYTKYLKVAKDGNSYMLTDYIKNKKAQLILIAKDAKGLSTITDINYVEDIHDLNITQVTELTDIGLQIDNGKSVEYPNFTVMHNNRLASLTYPMLEYIKQKGWFIDAKGNYIVDLVDWPTAQPILTLPLRNLNMADHAASISTLIESRITDLEQRDKHVSPSAMLVELFDLVNSKLSVNIAVLEVVLYGSMVVSAEGNDYRLPKAKTLRGFGVSADTIPRRSISGAMAFESQVKTMLDPLSFSAVNRPSYCMDAFICPKEAAADELNEALHL